MCGHGYLNEPAVILGMGIDGYMPCRDWKVMWSITSACNASAVMKGPTGKDFQT